MKIAAGGLQSLASQEVAPLRRVEPASAVRREDVFPQGAPTAEDEKAESRDLIKAVGRLNQAAEAFNQPLEFLIREREEQGPVVELVDKQSKKTRAEVELGEVVTAAEEPLKGLGLLLDRYM